MAVAAVAAAPATATSAPDGVEQRVAPAFDREQTYQATVRRSEGGVPNIKADDYASLGYGTGYAMAEDNICMISDLVITFAAERATRMGATAQNVGSDSFYQLFIDRQEAEEQLDERQAKIFRGAAAGFNRYLRDTGIDGITDPACQGASWLRPITELDLRRISRMPFFLSALSGQFLAAAPPAASPQDGSARRTKTTKTTKTGGAAERAISPGEAVAGLFDEWRGSNGVAIGRDGTAGGTGMLLANPHLSWYAPSQRMYALHQTIPGVMNMTGATTMGRIQVAFGATDHVAWTSTVSTAKDYTFYRLDLVPGHPTRYYFDGEERAMVEEKVSVQVPDGAGGTTIEEHTFYSTHFGARLVGGPGFTWDDKHAYAVRSIDPAWRGVESLNETWKAKSVEEFADILNRYQAMTTNVMAADSSGRTYYTDANPIPYVTDEQRATCGLPGGMLDGSRAQCMWQTDPTAAEPGTFGPEKTPHLFRDDFVANMNDSHWLSNPAAPLTGYDGSFGTTGTERTLRTRAGLTGILTRLAGADGASGDKFTLRGLQRLMFDNTSQAGVISRDGMVALCEQNPTVTVGDAVVDIAEACGALRGWDLRDDLDSRGAHLFREIMAAGGATNRVPTTWRYLVPFDAADPVNTPRDLDPHDNPAVLQAIAKAVTKLRDAGVPLDARLGDLQSVTRNGERIPMHGGTNASGIFNTINAPFNAAAGGYPDVTAGASWIQASEFRSDGLVSKGIIAFSQSTNPNSPHFSDMTKMFSKKQWVDLPMSESDVAANTVSQIDLSENAGVCAGDGWREWQAVDFADEAACSAYYDGQRSERLAEYDDRQGGADLVHDGGPVKVQGKARVGNTLRVRAVSPQEFSPAADTVSFQWVRDGAPIPAAMARRYVVTAADVGARLAVRVTGSRADGASGEVTSPALSARRAKAKVRLTVRPAKPSSLKVRAVVKAKADVRGVARVTVRLGDTVLRSAKVRVRRDGVLTMTAPAPRRGRYVVTVQYLGSDSVEAARATRSRLVR